MNDEETEVETVDEETEEENANELIDKANQAAERLEGANKELSALLSKQQRMKVEDTLGGTATAGISSTKTKEEIAVENAEKLLVGTGHEGLLEEVKPKV